MQDELSDFTLETIYGVLFGDYPTPKVMEDVKRLFPVISGGLISFPVRFPWPLSLLPALGFGTSMDTRGAFQDVVRDVLQARRADLAPTEGATKGTRCGGLLDSLMEVQRQQTGLDELQEGSISSPFDDDFIIDNIRGIL